MDSSNAPQAKPCFAELTEAEAALAALGPQLEWRKWNAVGGDKDDCYAQRGATIYTCARTPKSEPDWQAAVKLPQREVVAVSFGYKTVAAAQAACERHYATGSWE